MADPPSQETDHLIEAFRYTVAKLFFQQAQKDNLQVDNKAIFVLSELLLGYIEILTTDLEAFCRHGKRTTITADDVLLCCRRNESLKEKMERFLRTVNPPPPPHSFSGKKGKNNCKSV
ncbi:hypothetical protein GpartN1_g4884.t1 [Galdieria partita]|uniref:Centromere protein S n=1 Tax=Galdieria partita TaxID=83374 RepID=A0A9C7PY67_9RHOD|nr:hypothetical protein GpartN1_g4884.t1 [Galdieria partita]